MHFLNLIRYKNLLFIIALQWLMRYSVIHPIFKMFNLEAEFLMTNLQFSLLVAASVLIAAGGYVINDIFDTRTDEINRSNKVIIGNSISKDTASNMHLILTGLGIILGLIDAYLCKSLSLGLIIVMIPGMLWFYSASYKRQYLTGNIIISLCAAFVPISIAIAEVAFLSISTDKLIFETPIPKIVYIIVCTFAGFAFLGTLIREIIKDIEDIEGDKEIESRTLPIVSGINKAKIVLYGLIGITITSVLYVQSKIVSAFSIEGFQIINDAKIEKSPLSFSNTIFILPILFAFLIYLIIKAKSQKDFHQSSNFMKLILAIGSLHAIIFHLLLT